MVFDGRPVKLWAGIAGSVRGDGRSLTAAWGGKLQAFPWLDFDIAIPWKHSVAPGHDNEESISVSGPGDISLTAAFDLLELVNPSLARRECDVTGAVFWKSEDHFRTVKNPHLSISISLSLPTGPCNAMDADGCEPLPPEFQPGAGVLIPSVGLDFSQGIGSFTPGIGIRGSFPVGADQTGLKRASSWSFTAGTCLRSSGKNEAWALNGSIGLDWTPFESTREGAAIHGSAGSTASFNLSGSIGLGRGFVLALQLNWSFWEYMPESEEPFEPGFGAGLHLVMPIGVSS